MADITQINVGGTSYNLRDTSKLPKITYEWNKEYPADGTVGYILIGSFPMYDSHISIDIIATTSTTYHGTLVIATQNVATNSIGSAHDIHVYGDPSGTISSAITVTWSSGSQNYNVYFTPQRWSKNVFHIRAVGLAAAPAEANICKFSTGSAPATTSGLAVVNKLTSTFAGKGAATEGPSTNATGDTSVSNTGVGGPTETGSGGPTATGSGGPTVTGGPSSNATGGASSTNTGNGGPTATGASSGNTGAASGTTTISHITGSFTNGVLTLTSNSTTIVTTAHVHSLNSHTHSIATHSHSMSHTHSIATHTHSIATHSHLMSHTHSLSSHTHTQK